MAFRYTVEWSTSGGPGTSTFHLADAAGGSLVTHVNAIRAFFDAVKALLPADVTLLFPGEVIEFEDTTGELFAIRTVTAPASVIGTSVAAYAAPTGARVRWSTGGIVRGRRVTGTTFLVPLAATSYDSQGSIVAGTISTIEAAATALRSALGGNFVVWSKPTSALPSGGQVHTVSGSSCPDRAAILRSRRD